MLPILTGYPTVFEPDHICSCKSISSHLPNRHTMPEEIIVQQITGCPHPKNAVLFAKLKFTSSIFSEAVWSRKGCGDILTLSESSGRPNFGTTSYNNYWHSSPVRTKSRSRLLLVHFTGRKVTAVRYEALAAQPHLLKCLFRIAAILQNWWPLQLLLSPLIPNLVDIYLLEK